MKQCEKCGHEIEEGAAFCTNCGTAVNMNAEPGNVGAPMGVPMGSAPTSAPMGQPVGQPMGTLMGQPMMSTTMPEEAPKKKLDGKMIAIIAASAICLVIGIVGIVLAITSNNNKNDNRVAVNTDAPGGSTVDATSSGTKVSYAGYEFAIPDGYEYAVDYVDSTESLMVSNSDDYTAAIMYFNDVTFAALKSNIDVLAENIGTEMGTMVISSIETVDGIEFLCLNIGALGDTNLMFAISDADLYYFKTVIATKNNADPASYLSDVAKVVGSAQKKKSNRSFNDDSFSGLGQLNLGLSGNIGTAEQ